MSEILVLPERVRNIIALGESHFREFKSAFAGKPGEKRPRKWSEIARDVAEALVAFANADGGDLLIGVEDNGLITGLPHSDEEMQNIVNAPRSHVHPKTRLPLQFSSALELDGKKILFFSVAKGASGVFQLSDGRCMRRNGTSTVPESVDRILFDQREARSRSYDSEFVDEAQVNDLDMSLVQASADRYLRGISPEKYLQQIGLAEYAFGGLRLRRAALLLFARDIHRWHPRCQVRILKVHGLTLRTAPAYNVSSDEFVEGNIFDLLIRSWEALRPFLAYKTDFGSDARFEQKYIYPEWACREALVNAIAHRDYSIQSSIDVFIFDDRIELRSPGALLSTLSIEQLKKLEGAHESRNAMIARALRESGYMRELGEGMKRIFELMEQSDLQTPHLETDENSFTVTLYHRSVFSAQQLAWLEMFESVPLSRNQQRIVVAGMDGRQLSTEDIYAAINTDNRDTYDREVTFLRTAGILIPLYNKNELEKLFRQTRKPKRSLPRFRIVDPVVFQDVSKRKIVIFNLPLSVKRRDVDELFGRYGQIVKIELPEPRAGFSTRYGFVTFADSEPLTILTQKQNELYIGSKSSSCSRTRKIVRPT